jgi:hypothetical protein
MGKIRDLYIWPPNFPRCLQGTRSRIILALPDVTTSFSIRIILQMILAQPPSQTLPSTIKAWTYLASEWNPTKSPSRKSLLTT